MTLRSALGDVLAALVGLYAGYVAVVAIQSMISSLFTTELEGGVGAVSFGISEAVVVELAPAVVANRVLARWARQAGRATRNIHRAHTVCLVLLPVIWAIFVFTFPLTASAARMKWTFALSDLTYTAQYSLLFILLLLFLMRPRSEKARTLR